MLRPKWWHGTGYYRSRRFDGMWFWICRGGRIKIKLPSKKAAIASHNEHCP